MSKIKCYGETAKDCWECGKWRSSNSSHYSYTYDRFIVEINCGIGGCRVFEDNNNNTGKRLE